MAYLAIQEGQGEFYAYRQESYREGGKVKTRTLEYLGAVDPATAQNIKGTRASWLKWISGQRPRMQSPLSPMF